MADFLVIDGWPVAQAEVSSRWVGSTHHAGHHFLFRTATNWTLLKVQHRTDWGELPWPDGGGAHVRVVTVASLPELRAAAAHPADWLALLHVGSKNDEDLRQLCEQQRGPGGLRRG